MKAKLRSETRIQYNDVNRRSGKLTTLNRPEKLEALGAQMLIEMRDCLTEHLDDLEWVKGVLVEAARRAQATIVDMIFHKFNPVGISGVVVIAESHLTIHTWPEYRYAAVDIFSCGKTLQASEAASYMIEQFRSVCPSIVEIRRGVFSLPTVKPTSPGVTRQVCSAKSSSVR